MTSISKTLEAVEYLKKAAEILEPNQPYTKIELLAAFNRGIKTISKPVLKPTKA